MKNSFEAHKWIFLIEVKFGFLFSRFLSNQVELTCCVS